MSGRNGIKAVAVATRTHPDTVTRGVQDLEGIVEPVVRVRLPGGGRKKLLVSDPQLLAELKALVDPETRGIRCRCWCGRRSRRGTWLRR